MTPPSLLPTSTTKAPRARRRRAKHGIVAAYIHDISPRHRAASDATAEAPRVITARPVVVPAAAPAVPAPAR